MRATSKLYQQILRDRSHRKRHRAFVAGVEYGQERILSEIVTPELNITQPPFVSAALFSGNAPGIGSCVAKQLDILLLLQETPPPMAEIRLETQLVLTDPLTGEITAESEWIPKGTFFIDTRRHIALQDETAPLGALLIHGYDAMLKAEQVYLTEGDTGVWPRIMSSVVGDIASRMGVSIDSRTVLNGAFKIGYPGDYTMREILGYIAAAHAGNWIITDAGTLWLVPLTGSADAVDIQDMAASLDYSPAFGGFTGVRLWYDDEACFFAGDATGRVLEADCPWATQAMADAALSSVSGFIYQPYSATGAVLDPAAELGDSVSLGGMTGQLAAISTTFDGLCAADVASPADEEVDHEYPYLSRQDRELQRKMSLGQSYYGTRITRQNGLEVVTTTEDGTEKALVQLNSDVLAFYDAGGDEALYFDAAAGKYRFRGDVQITGGTMNVNDNFIVDEKGNLTINGNINLSGGTIIWGGNAPGGGGGISESDARTLITKTLVSSPNISGGKFWDIEQTTYLKMYSGGDWDSGGYEGSIQFHIPKADEILPVFNIDYVNATGGWKTLTLAAQTNPFLQIDLYRDTSNPQGSWDFSNATVKLSGATELLNEKGVSSGWIGSGSGEAKNDDGSIYKTYGVALASSTTAILPDGSYSLDFDSDGRYILVTTDGIKLKSGENTRITLTDNVISVRALNGKQFQYNGSEVVTKDMLRAWGVIN